MFHLPLTSRDHPLCSLLVIFGSFSSDQTSTLSDPSAKHSHNMVLAVFSRKHQDFHMFYQGLKNNGVQIMGTSQKC